MVTIPRLPAVIGFTGTHTGMSPRQMQRLIQALRENGVTELHHGDCIGADSQAHWFAVLGGQVQRIVIHPPSNPTRREGRKASDAYPKIVVLPEAEYLARNRAIVNATQALIAAPRSEIEETRSGTWATIRYARKLGRSIYILPR